MNKNFKIGDRIKVVKKGEVPMYSEAVVGDVGEIIAEREGTTIAKTWLVRFDTPRKFYHTGGRTLRAPTLLLVHTRYAPAH